MTFRHLIQEGGDLSGLARQTAPKLTHEERQQGDDAVRQDYLDRMVGRHGCCFSAVGNGDEGCCSLGTRQINRQQRLVGGRRDWRIS